MSWKTSKILKFFFTSSGFCKFGADCSYVHPQPVSSPLESDIDDEKAFIQNMKQHLIKKEIIIKVLQEKVKILEYRPSEQIKNSWEICGKTFESEATLITHVMQYHKQEVLRVSDQALSIQLSPTIEQRNNSKTETEMKTEGNFKCNYYAGVFSEGNNSGAAHDLKTQSCYGCDDEINDDLAIG